MPGARRITTPLARPARACLATALACGVSLGGATTAGAVRLVSPTGDAPVLTERQLLDGTQPAQAIAPGLRYELEPGEPDPVAIEVVGTKYGTPAPKPQGGFNAGGFGDLFDVGFSPSKDKFFHGICMRPCEMRVPALAGRFYWHVRPGARCVNSGSPCTHPWSETATFTIPRVFRVNKLLVPAKTRPCATAAIIGYDYNVGLPAAFYKLTVHRPGSRRAVVRVAGKTGNRQGKVPSGNGEWEYTLRIPLDRIPAGRYLARVKVRAPTGETGSARSRVFTVPNPSATCRHVGG
jgi:hypothetical protein